MGTSADGTALAPRTAVNKKFYGEKIEPKDVVFGQMQDLKPEGCEVVDKLHATLLALEQPK